MDVMSKETGVYDFGNLENGTEEMGLEPYTLRQVIVDYVSHYLTLSLSCWNECIFMVSPIETGLDFGWINMKHL